MALMVASGMVFTVSEATSPVTYMVSGNAGSFVDVEAHRGPLGPRPGIPQCVPPFPGEPLLEQLIGQPRVGDGRLAAQRRRLAGAQLVQPGVDFHVHPADEEGRHRADLGQVAPSRLGLLQAPPDRRR
jgi:hypothetical protein